MPHPHHHVARARPGQLLFTDAVEGTRLWRTVLRVAPAAGEPLVDGQKLHRTRRYVHLNPCRARLVTDPLAWPWSTHRDAVGLSLDPAVERQAQPRRFHAYVSSDPHVAVEGTELPDLIDRPPTPEAVLAVVASLARVPRSALRRRGRWRQVYLGIAHTLCDASGETIAQAVGASRGVVVHPPRAEHLRIVARAVHDPRMQDPVTLDWPRRYRAQG